MLSSNSCIRQMKPIVSLFGDFASTSVGCPTSTTSTWDPAGIIKIIENTKVGIQSEVMSFAV